MKFPVLPPYPTVSRWVSESESGMTMKRRLDVLCPQEYEGTSMQTTACDRCSTGWSKKLQRCTIDTGAEHLPDEAEIPTCPIQHRCQHQIQSAVPCVVRQKGLICESALIEGGLSETEASEHPLGFHAMMMVTAEDLAEEI